MAKRENIDKMNEKKEQKDINAEPLKMFIAIAPFCIGIAHEWASSLTCIFLLGYLWYCYFKTGKIKICNSETMLFAALMPLAYGISAIWAVDSGMAVFGMIKFLPLPIFVLAIGQLEHDKKVELLEYLPLSGTVMTLVSVVLSLIPVFQPFFSVNHRLAGFYQYPNTFALYLLIGLAILISNEKWSKRNIFFGTVLLAGIVLTGSRTGFALLVFMILCYCILIKNRSVKIGLFVVLIGIFAVTGIFVIVTGNTSSIGRYLTTSLTTSTFLGRLLYFKDAVPIILKHPLGLGYMGYYYSQVQFQSGVYSVINIHNELLQLLLDVGWIPTVLFLWRVITGIRKGNLQSRMIIILIMLHSMLDFNLQFISIFFILLVAVDVEEKTMKYVKKRSVLVAASIIAGCISVYFGVVSCFNYLKMYSAASLMYPGNTRALMELLVETDDVEEMEKIADKILKLNPDNSLANSAKARVFYSKGDFGNMIVYKQRAINYSKYSLEEYLDYFDMLYVGYQLYLKYGDVESAEQCRQCMLAIPDMMKEVLTETDPLAYKINDKPDLELPEEYKEVLRTLE